MAIRFIEGFELNAATSDSTDQYYERKMASVSGTPGQGTGLLVGSSLSTNGYTFTTPEFTDQDVWIIHWAWNLGTVQDTGQATAVQILRAGAEQLSVDVRSFTGADGADRYYVDIKRGATTLATAGPFWANKWYQFELKVTIDPTAGAYELKVDDVSQVSDTGVNTAEQAVADADQFTFVTDNGSLSAQLDHVIVADDTGTANNDFMGPSLVIEALPNAEGDDLDWNTSTGSTHNVLVNEAMPSGSVSLVEDPKRVTSETVSDIDRWGMTDLTTKGVPSGATILGVSVETCAGMEASGTRDLRAVFKDTTTATAEGDSFTVDTTAFSVSVQVWEENPATASSWTVSTIDAAQFGVKVQA